ncbi:C-terminal processing protease CtpA/Prc, contains a PDZ domain [Chitinophaga terrae (ex Kim and Jung 2007)]|uniref:C-terminal processing protease CtpA/Prc, contains a PDZ domain n=1 Tax=Chitinophaga terrae (ex Kim and Jung 2007) TaxID=408074 RepID=A0A1H4EAS8_9BACT|nr:S41 family peptidase [Chitinophaga terrae (ex Kim and Jung 2007)]GEP91517.1 peptidase S41 [Chitinophaga terrae (ex Kim and Jung 2007)]SEA82154.1 C-terminal processing protease CtpA/Prc, contains a PDZ domain [Chitinophaga terrae (ex Kim and Jung 2007)]
MQRNRHFKTIISSLVVLTLLFSCKKKTSDEPIPNPPGNGSNPVSLNDSIFTITKDIYLWTDDLPDSAAFKPDSYSSPYDMFEALIKKKPLDRYSFIDDGSTSRALQEGIVGDKGFEVGWQTDSTLFVIYVYAGSPADKKGIKRGWQLTNVNGTTKFVNGKTSNDLLTEAIYYNNSATFGFKKPDGTIVQPSTLTSAEYKLNPILYSKLYDFNGTKIGYFVFNNFVALADVKTQVDSIFDSFAAAGAKQLIIDLRYNGGGLVETAEYLANRLVPASKNNTVMYTQTFNSNVSNNKFSPLFKNMKALPYFPNYYWADIFYSEATTYKTANFAKQGGWEPTKVSFLVTYSTVSASELLYNNLKPVMNTKLIGTTTYGKPVGFIDIPLGQNDLFAVSFQTKNSQGQGDYFNGLTPEIKAEDDYSYDWGSFNDPLLKAALLDNGVPASSLGRMARLTNETRLVTTSNNRLQSTRFKGMFHARR